MSTKYFLGARILLNILSASSYLTLTVLQVMDYILHCTEETKVPRGFTICPKSRGQLSLVWLPNLCAELLPNTPFLSQPESQKTYLPLSESPPAVALTQPIPRLPHENSLLSPYAQVQWQVHHCPLTNVHFKAVINLLESELLPPTWAIFRPFSGIIIRNKDVNISSPQPGRGPEDTTLVISLWEAALWATLWNRAYQVTHLERLNPFLASPTTASLLHK